MLNTLTLNLLRFTQAQKERVEEGGEYAKLHIQIHIKLIKLLQKN
jgi:hypothetical protein